MRQYQAIVFLPYILPATAVGLSFSFLLQENGVLNTVLYFPSGAVYPQQGFPGWMQAIAAVDPFTYAVHAFTSLLLKNTGFTAIGGDLLYLSVFTVIAMTLSIKLFRRTL